MILLSFFICDEKIVYVIVVVNLLPYKCYITHVVLHMWYCTCGIKHVVVIINGDAEIVVMYTSFISWNTCTCHIC